MTPPPVHPIEAESYRILAERVDLSAWPPLCRAVVARVIHAAADVGYAETLVVDEAACAAGVAALRAGAPVVADVDMVAVASRRAGTRSLLAEGRVRAAADRGAEPDLTVSAAAMRVAAERWPAGAVVVVGNAPTALREVVDLAAAGRFAPALVIGLPVGFVGAAESKAALRASGLPSVSNVGERGGSAVAAAALNALWRLSREARVTAPTVDLVGAGPGDPLLLTRRAARLLAEADVVVADRPSAGPVLALARAGAERCTWAGRPTVPPGRPRPSPTCWPTGPGPGAGWCGSSPATRSSAPGAPRRWRPCRPGRPRRHPGVTAATAAPLAAALRGAPRSRWRPATPHAAPVPWEALADPGATLVVLTGRAQQGAIAARLSAAGLPGDTPAAVVHAADRPGTRVARTTLTGWEPPACRHPQPP